MKEMEGVEENERKEAQNYEILKKRVMKEYE